MADSRPPDISERVYIDLSGRISAYYDPTTYKYDVAVGGMPFIYAITDNTPYRRQTAEFRTARVDQLRDPGEQSLSGSGYWIRSQYPEPDSDCSPGSRSWSTRAVRNSAVCLRYGVLSVIA